MMGVFVEARSRPSDGSCDKYICDMLFIKFVYFLYGKDKFCEFEKLRSGVT